MTRRRQVSIAAVVAVAVLVALTAAGWLVLESHWLRGRVRDAIVAEAGRATGGRVEIGSVRFDWKRLRAELDRCTLHGTEPAGKPPLFQAARITVGLKIVSLWKRQIDLRSIEITQPRIFLMILPDGRTNLPQPRTAGGNAVETILSLAIGRFQVSDGGLQVESAGRLGALTPFSARGENLGAVFGYAAAPASRYRGTLGIHPLEVNGVRLDLDLAASLEQGRLTPASGRLATAHSTADLSAGVLEFAGLRARLHYDARVSLDEVARLFHAPGLDAGEARATGLLEWSGGQFTSAGDLRASGVGYRDSILLLRNGTLAGAFTANSGIIEIDAARLSAACRVGGAEETAQGRIAAISLHGGELELRGVALETMGGMFRGQAALHDFDRYQVSGDVSGFDGRRLVALYSAAPLPWDALAAGAVRVEGSLRRSSELQAEAQITLAPAAAGPPVHGRISATWDARTGILGLGSSTLALPSSRAEFSGSPGDLRVRLETRDLNDLLPVLGENAAALPVRLEGGSARFEGAITGALARPQFAGHTSATRFRLESRTFDSLEADVTASPGNVHVQNAVLTHGPLRAGFDAAVALEDWHAADASQIFGSAHIANAPLADLLDLLGWQAAARGSLSASADFSGTLAKPLAAADLTVVQGSYGGEPFDRLSGHLTWAGDTITLEGGALAAGPRQVTLAGSFRHSPGRLDMGQVHWQAGSNAMAIGQIQMLAKLLPGLTGTVELRAAGDLNLTPALRVAALNADVTARTLQLAGQPLGDAHILATSQGTSLHANLEAGIAGSTIRGDGTVGLEGDYPVNGAVTFTRVDLARLRPWIPGPAVLPGVTGFAEGGVRISGSALRPEAIEGELQLARLEIAPADATGPAASLALHNSAPIVVALAGSQLTLRSVRLAGRATDIAIAGKIDLRGASPLDLRVNGQVDAEAIHEFDPDLTASGIVVADAAVRGAPASPQITGRVQFEKVACNVAGFPNGLSNAAGVILFSGNRATIQNLSGETGGGRVQLTGFAGYDGNRLVFQLQAQARQVRIRYPEGVSTVADAALRLTGTSDRSTLGGTITIRRSGFNPQSDLSSVVARSAEPLEMPSARQGVLAGMSFDVQIDTAPDVQVQSSLTDDLQVEANLRLRGNVSNPALIGRVNITQGQVVFYGTKYTVRQGSISFYNALKIEPVFDIDLETKVNGVEITLTVSGPLHHLNLTPRSDPPMQFSEIVALLATGTSPAGDPSLLSQQTAIPQGWQQLGASTLLGQAISNPVAGRLQRFFGVSRLRIDPTLPGVEINNPQARVTLEQQVTPDITFTYIVNVTSSNPQVVRLEWSLSRQWSVVALREENGVFGLDFFFKRRF